ncbi:response regulator [Candidatus Parcubacteria bacterium]|nr:response regulator [Candidatus Parcubacteria bacterium]
MDFKVLVVDDKKAIRDIVCKAIKKVKPDAKITTTSSGLEAVISIKDNTYDLVITGVYMSPGIVDGFDVLFGAKDFEANTKVFIMSGKPENRIEALTQGADVFLEKPFSINDLVKHIKESFPD